MEEKVTVFSWYRGIQYEIHHYDYYQEYELLGVVYKRFYDLQRVIDLTLENYKLE